METLRIDLEVRDFDMWRNAFGKDAGGRREVVAADVTVIAAAVEVLVMAQDQRRYGFALPAQ